MNNKFFLFLLLFGIYSNSTQAIAPNTPRVLAISSLALGSFWSSFGQNKNDSSTRLILTLLGSALVYYVSDRYTPHNKFASALKITKKVETDKLFRSRRENNAALYEILNMHEDYLFLPFLHAVKSLYNLFTDLEMAYRNVLSAPEDLPEDAVFEEKCKQLASHIEYLQSEIKTYTKRLMHTTQWYNEVNNDDHPYSEPIFSIYLDSVKWSTNLISPEVSIKVRTHYTAYGQIISSRLSFREAFFRSLVDLTA